MARKKSEKTSKSQILKKPGPEIKEEGKAPLTQSIDDKSPKTDHEKQNDTENFTNFLGVHSETSNDSCDEPEVEIVNGVDSHPNSYATWLSSQKVDKDVVESILSTLTNLVKQDSLPVSIDSDEDVENCLPAALNQAPLELSCSEVIGSNESYFNSTINSTEASFCMMNGSPEEIMLCYQFLIREVFLAFRRSSDSNLILRDKKMPDLMWATEFLIRIRENHFYTLTNLSCTLGGDMFDLTQVAEIMKKHRESCEGKFVHPKLHYKWSNIQKLAQFIPIILCASCRENTLDDATVRTLFEVFESFPSGHCANFTYSSSNKTMQKKLSEQTDVDNCENTDDHILKRTNRFRLILRDIFFDVPRSSDCNNVLNNTTCFIRNDNFRASFLKKLRKCHYCTSETMTVNLSESTFSLGNVPNLLQQHDSECKGNVQFPVNFEELTLLEKLVCLLPLLLCQDCNRSVLSEEQLTTLESACANLKGGNTHKGISLICRSKEIAKRPSDTNREPITEDPKKRFKKTM